MKSSSPWLLLGVLWRFIHVLLVRNLSRIFLWRFCYYYFLMNHSWKSCSLAFMSAQWVNRLSNRLTRQRYYLETDAGPGVIDGPGDAETAGGTWVPGQRIISQRGQAQTIPADTCLLSLSPVWTHRLLSLPELLIDGWGAWDQIICWQVPVLLSMAPQQLIVTRAIHY